MAARSFLGWLFAPEDVPLTNHSSAFKFAMATVGQAIDCIDCIVYGGKLTKKKKDKTKVNPLDTFYIKISTTFDNNKTTHMNTNSPERFCGHRLLKWLKEGI